MSPTETAQTLVHFDPSYKISCPPPGTGTPEFEKADAEAAAFFAAWRADFDTKTLKYIIKRLSPLAVQIVRWGRDELAAAMIGNDHPYVTRKMTELAACKKTGVQRQPCEALASPPDTEWDSYLQGAYGEPETHVR